VRLRAHVDVRASTTNIASPTSAIDGVIDPIVPGSLSAFGGGPEDHMEGRGCIAFFGHATPLVGPRKVPSK
jgi:hypothetical protein